MDRFDNLYSKFNNLASVFFPCSERPSFSLSLRIAPPIFRYSYTQGIPFPIDTYWKDARNSDIKIKRENREQKTRKIRNHLHLRDGTLRIPPGNMQVRDGLDAVVPDRVVGRSHGRLGAPQ
jgi:hypothetical protein